nr:MAG: acetyltransferase [bacterium]
MEFHPVDPDSPSYRFMGFVRFFEAAGFREVGRAGSRRHVMRLDLT